MVTVEASPPDPVPISDDAMMNWIEWFRGCVRSSLLRIGHYKSDAVWIIAIHSTQAVAIDGSRALFSAPNTSRLFNAHKVNGNDNVNGWPLCVLSAMPDRKSSKQSQKRGGEARRARGARGDAEANKAPRKSTPGSKPYFFKK